MGEGIRRETCLLAIGALAIMAALAVFASAALAAPADLDPSFDGDGVKSFSLGSVNDHPEASALQPDGKIVITSDRHGSDSYVSRLNSDGTFDTSFDGDGTVSFNFSGHTDSHPNAVAIQPDGKIVVAGMALHPSLSWEMAVARLNPNGSLDTSFDVDGRQTFGFAGDDRAEAVALQPDGRIVVAGQGGSNSDFAVARLNSNGSFDFSFDGDGSMGVAFGASSTDLPRGLVLQPDGKMVVVGSTTAVGTVDMAVARVNPNGSLDTSFDGDGKRTLGFGETSVESATSVVMQPDGKMVIAGGGSVAGDVILLRLNPDGSGDPSFDGDGYLGIDLGGAEDWATAIALQPNGRLVLAGYSCNASETQCHDRVMRRNANGTADATFNGGDVSVTYNPGSYNLEFPLEVALQQNGAILVTAHIVQEGVDQLIALARLQGDPPPPTVNYARPASATPIRIPLAPAYKPCTSPNSTHVGPLNYSSCTPPSQSSSRLTTSSIGTQGAFARLKALLGNAATSADEADISLNTYVNDVRCASIPGCTPGSDYNGSLLVRLSLRLTDRYNGLGSQSATVSDMSFDVPVTCTPQPSSLGSTCSFNSTLDTLVPGAVTEEKRSIYALRSLQVLDTGADGSIGALPCSPTCGTGDELPYLEPAVFLP